jgi:NAD(P)-dependent dehydrogenase (short-subunit alcohol dehydrogenase family)
MAKAGLDKMAADMAVELTGTGVHTLSLWPGLVRNELIVASGLTGFAGFSFEKAETPEFLGRVMVALANDPRIAELSGSTIVTAEAGVHYGIADEDGKAPESHRAAFGGGPIFGADHPLGG